MMKQFSREHKAVVLQVAAQDFIPHSSKYTKLEK
jgi:hypothetical protein